MFEYQPFPNSVIWKSSMNVDYLKFLLYYIMSYSITSVYVAL